MKNKIIKLYGLIPPIFKNRYFLSILSFIIWITFFSAHSLMTLSKQTKEIQNIKRNNMYYKSEISKDIQLIDMLSHDTLTEDLEMYLREELLLSKENEEIFIIE